MGGEMNNKQIKDDLSRVICSGDPHINAPHDWNEKGAFDLMNCSEDQSIPIFSKQSAKVISLYAAFILAAYDAGDL